MNGRAQSETTAEKVRNVSPIKINEFRISAGSPTNSTDSFIELYNAGDSEVDLSNWTLTEHPTQQPIFSSVNIPAGTKLAAKGFYLLGLANSGLAVPAQKGDTTIYVRSTTGMSVGDTIEIDTGSSVETRKIASLGTAAGSSTTLWQPLPEGPVITDPRRLDQRAFHRRGRRAVSAAVAASRSRSARSSASAMAPPIPPSRTPWKNTRWSRSPPSASRARKPGWRRTRKPATPTSRYHPSPTSPSATRSDWTLTVLAWDRDRHGHERRHAVEVQPQQRS